MATYAYCRWCNAYLPTGTTACPNCGVLEYVWREIDSPPTHSPPQPAYYPPQQSVWTVASSPASWGIPNWAPGGKPTSDGERIVQILLVIVPILVLLGIGWIKFGPGLDFLPDGSSPPPQTTLPADAGVVTNENGTVTGCQGDGIHITFNELGEPSFLTNSSPNDQLPVLAEVQRWWCFDANLWKAWMDVPNPNGEGTNKDLLVQVIAQASGVSDDEKWVKAIREEVEKSYGKEYLILPAKPDGTDPGSQDPGGGDPGGGDPGMQNPGGGDPGVTQPGGVDPGSQSTTVPVPFTETPFTPVDPSSTPPAPTATPHEVPVPPVMIVPTALPTIQFPGCTGSNCTPVDAPPQNKPKKKKSQQPVPQPPWPGGLPTCVPGTCSTVPQQPGPTPLPPVSGGFPTCAPGTCSTVPQPAPAQPTPLPPIFPTPVPPFVFPTCAPGMCSGGPPVPTIDFTP